MKGSHGFCHAESTMEKKVILIKLKDQNSQEIIDRFEEAYRSSDDCKVPKRYYNFSDIEDTSELIDGTYYFFALVYNNENNKENYIKVFLGTGKFSEKNNSLKIITDYISDDNNAVKSLRELSNLNVNKDFNNGEYVIVEDSEYLFSQIDFILSPPCIFEKNNRVYEPITSENNLHELAQRNEYCRRQYNLREPQGDRGEFQRDYERIIHSKAFRRMVDKAQVFSASKGDYYRTRMTHSQAVAQIARGIATELNLNLNLTEAIALGHDLGHTPFGHQGERTLNDILCNKIPIIKNADQLFEDNFGGFKHNYQSIRVASILEEEYFEVEGMDLSYQTLEGMLKHTSLRKKNCTFSLDEFINAEEAKSELKYDNEFCSTLEGQIVAVSDEIAQRGHDLDDALSSGMLTPEEFLKYLEFKKLVTLKNKIKDLFKEMEKQIHRRKVFPDINELINSRITSTVLSYFINDVIKASKEKMDNYSVDDFEENGYTVKGRIVWFSDAANAINQYLETLIANRVINSSEVSLFDNNGAVIVAGLFKAYYNNPRLIHRGTQRRIYTETRRFTQNVVDFELGNHNVIDDEIKKITAVDLADENNDMTSELKEEYRLKRKILVRNICDYISGMTDTYAINEYKRIEK